MERDPDLGKRVVATEVIPELLDQFPSKAIVPRMTGVGGVGIAPDAPKSSMRAFGTRAISSSSMATDASNQYAEAKSPADTFRELFEITATESRVLLHFSAHQVRILAR